MVTVLKPKTVRRLVGTLGIAEKSPWTARRIHNATYEARITISQRNHWNFEVLESPSYPLNKPSPYSLVTVTTSKSAATKPTAIMTAPHLQNVVTVRRRSGPNEVFTSHL